ALVSQATTAEMVTDVTAKVWPQITAALRMQFPKIDETTLGDLRVAYEKLLSDTVADAMNEAPAIYARYFTAAEMTEIAAFYRTPTGAKALAVMPRAMADIMPGLMTRLEGTKGKMKTAFDAILKQHGLQAK
ncbi:MAG TPA: DUF2059 domain-containing protein, partial [Stellaceae bacterium]|nr:DUF2059 domain-containing protein [Stellaceae bacterium]